MDSQPQTNAVALVGLTKRYGQKQVAVESVNLSVKKGEFFTLLGPSGCGKTTLLRLIAGLILPDEGDIWIYGERVNDIPTHRRSIGLVFQNYALFPHMTVRDNIEFGLRRKRVPLEEMRRAMKEMLQAVKLEGFEDRYPKQLSGGQQQRVALARALVTHPRLMLFDEPLSNLDLKLRLGMQIELKKIVKHANVSSIYVTHDQGEALTLSDRIAIMNNGRVVQVGHPREIYDKPKTRFTADFIGESNLFAGTLTEIDGRDAFVRTVEDLLIHSQLPDDFTLSKGDKVWVVVRPATIQITVASQPLAENSFAGILDGVAYKGNVIRYHVMLNDHLVSSDQHRDLILNVGDKVRVEWKAKDTLLVCESN
jgi:spermidine/putrescine ABC transporter ATP-binding subunit